MALNTIIVLSKFSSVRHVISCDWVSWFTYAAHQHGCIRAWTEHKEKHRASWWSTPHCCSRCTVCIILRKKILTSASMAVRRHIIFKLNYYINKAHCTHVIPVLLTVFFSSSFSVMVCVIIKLQVCCICWVHYVLICMICFYQSQTKSPVCWWLAGSRRNVSVNVHRHTQRDKRIHTQKKCETYNE